jgi:hypothetical protein
MCRPVRFPAIRYALPATRNHLAAFLHDLPLVPERQPLHSLADGSPPRLGDLVIVIRDIAGPECEEKEMDGLVKSHALTVPIRADVPVVDRLDRCDNIAVDPGLLTDFSPRRLLGRLAWIDEPFWKLPAFSAARTDDRDLDPAPLLAKHDATGGDLAANGQGDSGGSLSRGHVEKLRLPARVLRE